MIPEEMIPEEEMEKANDATIAQNDRCYKVATELLQIIVESGLPEDNLRTRGDKHDRYMKILDRATLVVVNNDIDAEDDLELVSKILGSSFFMLNHYLKESIKANQALLSKAIYGINEEDDNRVTVKMLSDMVVRRAKLRELGSQVLKSDI